MISFRDVLVKHGFTRAATSGPLAVVGLERGDRAYDHPDESQVVIHSDGTWDWSNVDGTSVRYGVGPAALDARLNAAK